MSNRLIQVRQPAGRGPGRPIAVAPAGRLPGGEAVVWLVLAALAIAVLDQGGFHARAQALLGLALVSAVAAAAWTAVAVAAWPAGTGRANPVGAGRLPDTARQRGWTAPAVAASAWAGWALLDGWLHGAPAAGIRPALLMAAVGAVIWLCRRLDAALRARLVAAVVVLGCVAGLLGWYGVAGHVPAFALTGQGVWRAMGSLGYPNATAALLAGAAMVALAGQVRPRPAALEPETAALEPETARPVAIGKAFPRWAGALASTVLLTGLGATFSRGGLLAAAGGLATLAVLLGPRRVAAAAWAPVLGAAVGVAGLLPAASSTTSSRPAVAAVALAVGLSAGTWLGTRTRLPRSGISLRRWGVAGCALVLGSAFLAAARGVLHARFELSSGDRLAAWHAGVEVARRHPVTGIGPGAHTFDWSDSHGGVLVFRYLHDEYLQVLAELGAVGLLLSAVCLAALVRVLRGYRPRSVGAEPAAAALAVLVTVGTSALFDFTGHFPAVVLTAAALVGCAEPARPAKR